MRSFEDSLQRLGMNRVDILLIHDCDEWSQGARYEEALRTVETGALRALRRLKDEGTIGAFGAGVNQAEACERLMDIGDFDCFMLAGRYTLLEQGGLDSFLPRAEAAGVSVLLAAPFNSGILVTGAVDGRDLQLPARARRRAGARAGDRAGVRGARGAAGGRRAPVRARPPGRGHGHPRLPLARRGGTERRLGHPRRSRAALWADLKSEGLLRADAPVPA